MSRAVQRERPRWQRTGDMVLRILAAIPIGYAVGSLWAMALARLLPGDRAQATIAATLMAFVICAVAAMWAFTARSGWRALWTLSLFGALAAGITWISITMTGRL
jgi:ABC-type sugar transport system permease subunit